MSENDPGALSAIDVQSVVNHTTYIYFFYKPLV